VNSYHFFPYNKSFCYQQFKGSSDAPCPNWLHTFGDIIKFPATLFFPHFGPTYTAVVYPGEYREEEREAQCPWRWITGGAQKSQQCRKSFPQYSTFAPRGRQRCFLPRTPSNLGTFLRVPDRFPHIQASR